MLLAIHISNFCRVVEDNSRRIRRWLLNENANVYGRFNRLTNEWQRWKPKHISRIDNEVRNECLYAFSARFITLHLATIKMELFMEKKQYLR